MRLLLVALLLGLLAVAAAAEAPGPLVAFNGGLNGGRVTLVTVAPDGTSLRNLTPGDDPATADTDPSWSPDGTRIAFDSRRDGNVSPEIYVMNADGSDPVRLTHDSRQNGVFNTQPAWSPRSDLIAFLKSQNNSTYEVWVMKPDGSGQRALTADGGVKRDMSWSPDGTRLVYTRSQTAETRIYTVGLDGAPPSALSPAGATDFWPAWSPDGRRIAFSAPALTVMNADGANRHALTTMAADSPDWSLDGTRIAFAGHRPFPQYYSGRFGVPTRQDVFVVDTDGYDLRRLTGPLSDAELGGPPGGSQPTWWPDGSRLFYVGAVSQTTFQMNADGTCQGRFGPDGWTLHQPVWQPGPLSLPRPIRCADLRLGAAVAKSPIALEEPASFTFRIENDGNLTATSVRLDLTTPDDAVLSSPMPGCDPTATGLTCVVGPVAPMQSTTVALTGTRRSGNLIRVQGHVSAAEPDSDPTSNDAQTNAQVIPCTIVGTGGPDVLYGTDGPDRICALPGADTIYGGGGNDFIDAGNGDDRIYAGPGQDTVIARGGDDVIYARDGQRDWIDCGAQTDVAVVDRIDVVRHCEFVLRPPR